MMTEYRRWDPAEEQDIRCVRLRRALESALFLTSAGVKLQGRVLATHAGRPDLQLEVGCNASAASTNRGHLRLVHDCGSLSGAP